MAQTSLNSTGVASSAALSLQSNGTTEAIGISTGQVATLAQNPILTSGTVNGLAFLNASKVLTTGSALVFNATNLGIGVSPNAGWGSNARVMDFVGDGTVFAQTNANIISLGNNFYWDNTDFKYKTGTGGVPIFASKYTQFQGKHIWSNAPTGTAGSTITFTDAMTLDASGNLLLADTSNTTGSPTFYIKPKAGLVAQIAGFNFNTTSTAANPNNNLLSSGNYFNGTSFVATNTTASIYQQNGNIHAWYTDSGLTVGNTFAPTERARINSSGNLLVGTTSPINAVSRIASHVATGNIGLETNAPGDYYPAIFYKNGTTTGYIQISGSTTSYGVASDYRLKNSIAPMTGALAKVAALKPCTYKWNIDGANGEGFIAHELAEVCPYAVNGEKDAVDADGKPKYQGIDTSFLIATLTAAIQEQQALITSLTARITALEA